MTTPPPSNRSRDNEPRSKPGLIQLATGDLEDARETLAAARSEWTDRRRFWEGGWAGLDAARCALAGKRLVEVGSLAETVRAEAELVGAATLASAAEDLRANAQVRGVKPWHPLTEREWSVATLVSVGMTNRQIATELFLSPKTVSTHIEHVLAKLGAARRAEIAAWAAKVDV